MRHILGNSVKCIECKFYVEKTDNDKCKYDGWCYNDFVRSHGVNGKKISPPKERVAVRWNYGTGCDCWLDAECDLTAYEVLTGVPEPTRSEKEKDAVLHILQKAKQQQKESRLCVKCQAEV